MAMSVMFELLNSHQICFYFKEISLFNVICILINLMLKESIHFNSFLEIIFNHLM